VGHIDYSTAVTTIDGQQTDLTAHRGRVLLIVNTASLCGFTPQYDGLEALQDRFSARGFSVLGFPCNQFGAQEPKSEAEIATFCRVRFGVSFPLYAKVDVNGPDAHPLFQQLKRAKPGLLGSTRIKWNFTKFLVSADGEVVERFAPNATPASLADRIDGLL